MNERIRELAEYAWEYTTEQTDGWINQSGEVNWDFLHEYDKKFAEMIIKECARVARATPAPNFHEHLKQQLGHTWDMAASEAGNEIVKHFGVK